MSADTVLAGNLVPFRSPKWKPDSEAAQFDCELWFDIFDRAQPSHVVTYGGPAKDNIKKLLRINKLKVVVTPYINRFGQPAKIAYGQNETYKMVALPHLSEHLIMTHPPSQSALDEAFANGN